MAISVVDVENISINTANPSSEHYTNLAQEIKCCFREIGFMYIKNHGIPAETIEKAMKESLNFFQLPKEVKEKTRKGVEYQGWVEQGREIFDQDEDGNIAELEVRETFDIKNVSANAIFPDEDCPQLRKALTDLCVEAKELTLRLLSCLSLSLGVEADYLPRIHQGMLTEGQSNTVENCTTLRSIHYPPIPDKLAAQKGIIRCGEHSDYGTITLLFQDQLGGLEVKDVEGNWLSAEPIPGTILVNVGDLLESLSGGKYPATRHRVTIPETEFRRRTLRQSLPFFVHPDDTVVCQPLAGPDPRYPAVTARQHLENRFRATYGDRLE